MACHQAQLIRSDAALLVSSSSWLCPRSGIRKDGRAQSIWAITSNVSLVWSGLVGYISTVPVWQRSASSCHV